MNFNLFISCPKGLEYLLEQEVTQLGLDVTQVSPQGVYGKGDLNTAYNLCIWSRLANRVQVILFHGQAQNQQEIHSLCNAFLWETAFSVDKTFAVQFHGTSPEIRNTMFGAQVVKDGIVDHFQTVCNTRPTVTRENPQVKIHAYLHHGQLTVSFDLTGYSMHQRGYRTETGEAPLKENIAAAMLIRANWQTLAAQGFALYDPFCGSGTVVIEAAMIAANMAPGLLRDDQSLHHWTQHQKTLWDAQRIRAHEKATPLSINLYGTDHHPKIIAIAQANAVRAGVDALIQFKQASLGNSNPQQEKGLLICNPPYGERLGDATQLIPLYQQLGNLLHEHFQNWQAAIITSDPMLAKAIGLRAHKQYSLYNGALPCKLYCLNIDTKNQLKDNAPKRLSESAQMFANRLQKNASHLKKWADRKGISCYRVYDADLPEYAYAIDIYNDYAVLQEYAAPSTIDPHKAEKRSLDILQITPKILHLEPDHIIVKTRKQQKGSAQYEKAQLTSQSIKVTEGLALFKVNLTDYIDTGLFLDHRPLRLMFSKLKPATRFLNCFCYTATASVHAALAGAITTNIDLSKTYLAWAQENFALNRINSQEHRFIQEDVMKWLNNAEEQFNVIFLDPPSFSNSKRMSSTLDIQRDHLELIHICMRLLSKDGTLYFSTNFRKFKLSSEVNKNHQVEDITNKTIDLDYKRRSKIHYCFKITHNSA